MELFYFGDKSMPLFGIYNPPLDSAGEKAAVVLCYPFGQEHIRCYRLYSRLALSLASAGFHVLRFDYYGCGDSIGRNSEGTIKQWISDIATAIEEIKWGCIVNRVCLIGIRLGATLSLIVGKERNDIDCLVLWNPIINGVQYIRELDNMHQEWLRGSFAKPKQNEKLEIHKEVLGFPITNEIAQEFEKIDLTSFRQKLFKNVFLIDSGKNTNNAEFRQNLESSSNFFKYKDFPNNEVWIKNDDMITSLVPVQILQYIVSAISERF